MAVMAGAHRAARTVTVVRRIFIARDAGVVGRFLADVENLPRFEPKLELVRKLKDRRGWPRRMRARARIAMIPLTFDIDYVPHLSGGFESGDCDLLFVRFGGGFWVRDAEGGCLVSHVERYEFRSRLVAWIAGPAWRWYADRSIDREVARLKELLEEDSSAG